MAAALAVGLLLLAALALVAFAERPGRLRGRLGRPAGQAVGAYDPGRELRAQRRAERLLEACVEREAWEMYRELGFIRVWGGLAGSGRAPAVEYAYLLYPHKPLVAFIPQTAEVIGEYCVSFPAQAGGPLPAADDLLAKWLYLRADEEGLLQRANVHLFGTRHDPARVEADIRRLRAFERSWQARLHRPGREGSVPGGEPTAV